MKYQIKVIPHSKHNKIVEEGNDLKVYLTEKPVKKEKANKQLIQLLADYFHVGKSSINIISGQKSRQKIIDIKTISPVIRAKKYQKAGKVFIDKNKQYLGKKHCWDR